MKKEVEKKKSRNNGVLCRLVSFIYWYVTLLVICTQLMTVLFVQSSSSFNQHIIMLMIVWGGGIEKPQSNYKIIFFFPIQYS